MQIYLVKGYLDVAATSLVDAMALLAALANPSTSANSAAIARITGKLETIVQSDSREPLVISSIDDATGAISSWVTDSSIVVSVGLGDPDTGTSDTFASAASLAVVGSTRAGTLALNTTQLANALRMRSCCSQFSSPRSSEFTLQIRKSTAGATETCALLSVQVSAGVLSSTPSTMEGDTYLTAADAAATYAPLRTNLTVPFYYFGAATDEQSFGYFKAPVALDILGAQISAQSAPTGAAITIDLVDENGLELSLISTLAAGASYQQTTFGTAYSLAANGIVRLKIKSVGSTLPGGYLAINLLCRYASATSAAYLFPACVYFGTAADEQTFGYFQARTSALIIGLQISAQVAPVGSALTLDLVDSSGAELSRVATLAAGATYQATDFAINYPLSASDFVRLKIKSVGSAAAGAYLTVNLVTRPA